MSGRPDSPPAPTRSTSAGSDGEPGAADRGVRGDQPVQPEAGREVGDREHVVVGQVGGDLDQQRHPVVGDRVGPPAYRLEERTQPVDRLQRPQPRGVGRGHVHHEVVGVRRQQPRALLVVRLDRRLVALVHHLRLPDVDPHHHPCPPSRRRWRAESAPMARRVGADGGRTGRETAGDDLGAVVVEAHPVDDRPVGGEPEEPRLRVAGLGLAGDRADLDVPEAERRERVDADGVLVEAGGQPERVREGQSERVHRAICADSARHLRRLGEGEDRAGGADRAEGGVVGPLGVGAGEHPVEERVVRRQASSLRLRGRTWSAQSWSERTPMSPAISASMPCTAAPRPWTVVMHGMLAITAAVRIS